MNVFLTTLLKIINNPEKRDVNYQIAYTLIECGQKLKNMSLNEVAQKSYVSVSTFNRFIKSYGYDKYSIFKSMYLSHLDIRLNQMKYRLKNKKEDQVNTALKSFLTDEQYQMVTNKDVIHYCCDLIYQNKRIILVGSDEMEGMALRFQADFCVLGRVAIQDSIYLQNFVEPQEGDVFIILSMSGRIFELNKELYDKFQNLNVPVITIGYKNYLKKKSCHLSIPDQKDEVLENMVYDYYLQEIVYTYLGEYYDSRAVK